MLGRPMTRRAVLDGLLGAVAGVVVLPRLVSAGRAAPTGQPGSGPADLVLTNANVVTMNPARPVARAVAIRAGRIVAVGDDAAMSAWAGAATETRDLAGRTLIPGLFDSHNHMLRTGLNLGAVDLSETKSIADKRWTLVHMMAARPDHWDLVNKLRLAITAQQPLQFSLAAGFLKYLGPDRTKDIEPLGAYLENSRQPVGGGSDSPVTPYQPMIGIWSSVTRSTDLVGVQGPEWRITAEQALQMYTLGSAWCALQEDVLGSIEPGKYADLVALSADPRAVDPEAIRDIQAMVTIVDGKIVFDREHGHGAGASGVVRVTGPIDAGCACA